jgi:hypothetical protein
MKFSRADSSVMILSFPDVSGANSFLITLLMGTELFPETSGNLHILTLLPAGENLIEFIS